MQTITIDAHDPQFKSRLNAFAYASAHIIAMDLTDEATLDLIETISEALIEALHEESDYQAQITQPEEAPEPDLTKHFDKIGYVIIDTETGSYATDLIFDIESQAHQYLDSILDGTTQEVHPVGIIS